MEPELTPDLARAMFGAAKAEPDPLTDEHDKLKRLGVDVPEPAPVEPGPAAAPEAPAQDELTPSVFREMSKRRGDPLALALVEGTRRHLEREEAKAPKPEAKPEPDVNTGERAALEAMRNKNATRSARLFGTSRPSQPGLPPIEIEEYDV